MGRYYSGDIEGKFWFAVQSSTAASRFGGSESEPAYLNYSFEKDDLDDVNAEIKNIQTELGDKLQVIEHFFKVNNGYNSKTLTEANISEKELSEFADLELGIKIRDCIIKKGYCHFEAEL